MWLHLLACHAPQSASDPAFPYAYTPEEDLEFWAEARWETETWESSETEMAAGYLLKAAYHRKSAPVESREHFEQMRAQIPALDAGLQLDFVGDVMWVGDNWAEYATPVTGLLDGDLRIGNLETPTSPDEPAELVASGLVSFNADPAMLDGLPLDVLQLNNNHSIDFGDAALVATVEELDARGLVPTGVDTHAVVDIDGASVALLSYTWGINQRDEGSSHELFIVPFGHIGEAIDLEPIAADIAAADADLVVLLLHWGFEYEYYPDPHFMILARQLIAAGADLIVGQGPHVAQPPEICQVNRGVPEGIGLCSVETGGEPRTAAVLYSLGNFGTVMATAACQSGVVASVTLEPSVGVTGLGWRGIAIVDGPWIQPLQSLDDPVWIAEQSRLEEHLGRSWMRGE